MHALDPLRITLRVGDGFALDDRLIEALERGWIRLLRPAWLLAQKDGYRLQKRQDLEKIEAALTSGETSPLLMPEDAVALVRKGSRGAGVASHGWLSAGDPDMHGAQIWARFR